MVQKPTPRIFELLTRLYLVLREVVSSQYISLQQPSLLSYQLSHRSRPEGSVGSRCVLKVPALTSGDRRTAAASVYVAAPNDLVGYACTTGLATHATRP